MSGKRAERRATEVKAVKSWREPREKSDKARLTRGGVMKKKAERRR